MKKVSVYYSGSIIQHKFIKGSLYQRPYPNRVVLCSHNSDQLSGVIIADPDASEIGTVNNFHSDEYRKFSGTVTLED